MSNDQDQTLQRAQEGPQETILPDSKVRELEAEQENLRRQIADLEEQKRQLQKEREHLERECDRCLESLSRELAAQIMPVTLEELQDLQRNGMSQEELLAEINRLFPTKPAIG
jgi:hypothetical protein